MKKYIISLFIFVLLVAPVVGQTATLAELRAQLVIIQAQITALQNQSTPDCPFVRDLAYGDGLNNGLKPEVIMLQKWLIGNYLNIPKPTGYFGSLTLSALKRWQRDNHLVATGRLGAIERLKLCGR